LLQTHALTTRYLLFPYTTLFRSSAIPGKGARGVVEGVEANVVSPGFLKERSQTVSDARVARVADQGKTVVYVLLDSKVVGAIALDRKSTRLNSSHDQNAYAVFCL